MTESPSRWFNVVSGMAESIKESLVSTYLVPEIPTKPAAEPKTVYTLSLIHI